MTKELFRKEVLDAKRASWLGGISLAQPVPLVALTAFAALAALSIGLFLALGTYTRRSTVVGRLVPKLGLSTLLAPATGIVERIEIPEDGKVAAGQLLAVIRVPKATVGHGNTHAAMTLQLGQRLRSLEVGQAAQQDLFDTKASGLRQQLASTRAELAQIAAEAETRHKQARIAGETLDRLQSLQSKQYVSELQVKQQQKNALDQVGAWQALQRQAIVTRRNIAALEQALAELPSQRHASGADYQRSLALLAQDRLQVDANDALAVSAPVSGVVSTQIVKVGQAVQVGQPLMSLLPGDGELEAELLVPSRAIGFLERGDKVLLRYQAYPYQKFGHQEGRIASISRSALTLDAMAALTGGTRHGEPMYRVMVTLKRQAITAYGKKEPLKPDMLLEADVMGEKRRLIEWVFEPLYSLKGKVTSG